MPIIRIITIKVRFKNKYNLKKACSSYWLKMNEEINAVDKIPATMQYSAVLVSAIISQYE